MKIEEFKTDCLRFPLILLIDKDNHGFVIGSMTEEGGSYPLSKEEEAIIYLKTGKHSKTFFE